MRSFDNPDETRTFEKGATSILRLSDLTLGKTEVEPGWRWSLHVKPVAGTPSCQVFHQQLLLSGRLGWMMDDGSTHEAHAGQVYEIPAGHDAWVIGDERLVLIDFAGMMGSFAKPAHHAGDRVLATVLFTDIVGSTGMAERVGDARWHEILAQHNRTVRRELDRYRGREISTTGDGFLATFDSAARAVQCAAVIRDSVRGLQLEIRAGLHTGEVEYVGADVRGVVVHAAARIAALAGAGEVLVSGTTHDLLAGSELRFEDRGTHELKGLSGQRPVFALTNT